MVRPQTARVKSEESSMTADGTNSSWKAKAQLIWDCVGGAMMLIGAVELPESIRKWGTVFNAVITVLGHETVRWLFCISGFAVVVVANLLPYFRRPKAQLVPVPSTAAPAKSTALVVQPEKPPPPANTPAAPVGKHVKMLSFEPASIPDLMLYRKMVRAGTAHSDNPCDHLAPLQCKPCKGTGFKWARLEATCQLCGGTGELPGEYAQFPDCQLCFGRGLEFGRLEKFCSTCGGISKRVPEMANRSPAG
jgi:hypothetical protein